MADRVQGDEANHSNLLKAATLMDVEAENCIVIDSSVAGIHAAKEAGKTCSLSMSFDA